VTNTRTTNAERESATAEAKPGADAQRLSTADISGAADRGTPDQPDTKRVAPLFADEASTELRERWTEVQTGFVDQPREAVEQADALVAEVMKRLADSFATERQALEQQWSRGDDVSTEELRLALRRYRSFFDRLLSV